MESVDDEAPEDPFRSDPVDPASAPGGGAHAASPLDPAEAEEVLADLADLDVFRAVLEPHGVRGMAVGCARCDETHYLDWDLLHSNLRQLLEDGLPRLHEPAYGPDPDEYVTWEYARGYVDGVIDTEESSGH